MSLIVTCIQLWRNNETTSVSDFRNVSNYIKKHYIKVSIKFITTFTSNRSPEYIVYSA